MVIPAIMYFSCDTSAHVTSRSVKYVFRQLCVPGQHGTQTTYLGWELHGDRVSLTALQLLNGQAHQTNFLPSIHKSHFIGP